MTEDTTYDHLVAKCRICTPKAVRPVAPKQDREATIGPHAASILGQWTQAFDLRNAKMAIDSAMTKLDRQRRYAGMPWAS